MCVRGEFSTPRESWQNGTAERMNRTVLDRARTVLSSSGLSGTFWARATMYSVNVINSPYKARINGVPYTLLTGAEPDLSRFQPFGCKAYVYVDKVFRQDSTFDPKAELGIYCGNATDPIRTRLPRLFGSRVEPSSFLRIR